jgi:hypothetical protein
VIRSARTAWLALWLGLLALAAGTFEQHQFGLTTLSAAGVSARTAFAVPAGYHLMPDGTLMAGAMHGARATHADDTQQAPSDCDACVVLAAMAAFTTPAALLVAVPTDRPAISVAHPATLTLRAQAHPAYASRAPPVAMS